MLLWSLSAPGEAPVTLPGVGKLHYQIATMEHSRLDFTAAGTANDFFHTFPNYPGLEAQFPARRREETVPMCQGDFKNAPILSILISGPDI